MASTSKSRPARRAAFPLRSLGGLIVALAGTLTAAESRRPEETEPRLVEGYAQTDFSLLASFPITPPARRSDGSYDLAAIDTQIPGRVKRWHGRKTAVTGYMLPIKSQGGLVTELLLTQYTVAKGNTNEPTINEWIIVKVPSGVPAQTLLPISFFGVLKVGPVFENGYLVAIYEFTAERVASEYLL
jgi:hypothetical protein